jgi:hypothetical protein
MSGTTDIMYGRMRDHIQIHTVPIQYMTYPLSTNHGQKPQRISSEHFGHCKKVFQIGYKTVYIFSSSPADWRGDDKQNNFVFLYTLFTLT